MSTRNKTKKNNKAVCLQMVIPKKENAITNRLLFLILIPAQYSETSHSDWPLLPERIP